MLNAYGGAHYLVLSTLDTPTLLRAVALLRGAAHWFNDSICVDGVWTRTGIICARRACLPCAATCCLPTRYHLFYHLPATSPHAFLATTYCASRH